jgi:hypothetical protein
MVRLRREADDRAVRANKRQPLPTQFEGNTNRKSLSKGSQLVRENVTMQILWNIVPGVQHCILSNML